MIRLGFMRRIVKCGEGDYLALAEIWERSVRATHHFLPEDDLAEIKKALLPCYFPNVTLYAVDDDGVLSGFIGLADNKIEMLFVDFGRQGEGIGSMLIDFAMQSGATQVDVNEQNRHATAFYVSKGFKVVSRDDRDEAGRPYPILHMAL